MSYGFFAKFMTGAYAAGWVIGVILLFVFLAMIRWKIFVKAGEKGWKSLIPFYGDYTEYKIVWAGKWFWISLAASILSSIAVSIPLIGPTIFFACLIFSVVFRVILAMQEAYAFNKGDGFAIGLMTFKFVFQIILAFDNDIQYIGPQPTPHVFAKIANVFGEKTAEGHIDSFGEVDGNETNF